MLPPNFRRPAIKRISLIPYMYRWNHRVSVLAGSNMTTVAPFSADSAAFCTHFPISRPYGGLHQHTPSHSCTSPSSSGVKYRAHFAFSGIAQTSVSNANSSFSSSKKPCGVAHKSVSLENIKSLFMSYPPRFPQAFARPPPAGTHQVRPRGAVRHVPGHHHPAGPQGSDRCDAGRHQLCAEFSVQLSAGHLGTLRRHPHHPFDSGDLRCSSGAVPGQAGGKRR